MSVVAAGGTGLASVVKLTFGSLGTAPRDILYLLMFLRYSPLWLMCTKTP